MFFLELERMQKKSIKKGKRYPLQYEFSWATDFIYLWKRDWMENLILYNVFAKSHINEKQYFKWIKASVQVEWNWNLKIVCVCSEKVEDGNVYFRYFSFNVLQPTLWEYLLNIWSYKIIIRMLCQKPAASSNTNPAFFRFFHIYAIQRFLCLFYRILIKVKHVI